MNWCWTGPDDKPDVSNVTCQTGFAQNHSLPRITGIIATSKSLQTDLEASWFQKQFMWNVNRPSLTKTNSVDLEVSWVIGLPLVIIHLKMAFSILNHPAMGETTICSTLIMNWWPYFGPSNSRKGRPCPILDVAPFSFLWCHPQIHVEPWLVSLGRLYFNRISTEFGWLSWIFPWSMVDIRHGFAEHAPIEASSTERDMHENHEDTIIAHMVVSWK